MKSLSLSLSFQKLEFSGVDGRASVRPKNKEMYEAYPQK